MAEKETDALEDLEREAKEFDKDTEISRILQTFRPNAYAVLDLTPGVPPSTIQATYRKKSLLIHPDKTRNPSAPAAFDALKKAQTLLLDDAQRAQLDEAIADARMLVLRERKWTAESPETRERWFLEELWPEKIKAVLVDEELRRRKRARAMMAEEGRVQRREEEEGLERKRRREGEVEWEKGREGRIGSWREFSKGGAGGPAGKGGKEGAGDKPAKKKKTKLKVLG